LLSFLVSADLKFPQGPSARSSDFATLLTGYANRIATGFRPEKYPVELLKIGSLTGIPVTLHDLSCDRNTLTSTGPRLQIRLSRRDSAMDMLLAIDGYAPVVIDDRNCYSLWAAGYIEFVFEGL